MDITSFRRLHDSAWVRDQRDGIAAGERRVCPIDGCEGQLVPYDEVDLVVPGSDVPNPGGVRCETCGARSRPVAL